MKTHATTLSQLCETLRADVTEIGTQPAARLAKMPPGSMNRFVHHSAEPIVCTVDQIAAALGYGFRMIRIQPHRSTPLRRNRRPSVKTSKRKTIATAA